jgi:DNA-binding winged helix-turn-helix (wHTH) protein/TolB-like protein/tetratricopeptide (TPR) repeat protein
MSGSAIYFYGFDSFRVDVKKRLLLRDGEALPLTPKVFDTLLALIQHGGEALEKEELIKLVWPDSFVEEGNLSSNISLLRKALGEHPRDHRYIVTIPGRGYSFVAEVKTFGEAGVELTALAHGGTVFHEKPGQENPAEPQLPEKEAEAPHAATSTPLGVRHWAGKVIPAATGRKALALLILLGGALGAVVYALMARPSSDGAAGAQVRSITILPFASRSPGDEYLALGTAETLIARLRKIKQLTVRPTSAFQNYKSFGGDVLTVGRQLGVEAALVGEFRRAGEEVSIKVSLLRATDGARTWEQTFNGRLETFFALQDTITERVVAVLGLRLTRREDEMLRKPGAGNIEAFEAYLKGRFHWNDRSHEGLYQSMLYFEQAVEKDPRFALGYAGLASAYAFDGTRWPRVENLARKALDLDPTLAEPHAMLGFVRLFWERNWAEADQEFKQAVALDPTYATAYHWHALHVAILAGNTPGAAVAINRMRQALELEPFSPVLHADLGQVLYFARNYDEALAACQKALALDPDFINAHSYLYDIYSKKGLYDEAVEKFLYLAQRLEKSDPATRQALKQAYQAGGARGFWEQRIKILSRYPRDEYEAAKYYMRLGKQELALDRLEKAYRNREFKLIYVKVDPVFEDLSENARFRNLLRRLGMT